MAVNNVNTRSPYYVVASGSEGSTIGNASETQEEREAKQEIYLLKIVQVVNNVEKNSPGEGTSNANITLRAIPVNFTSNGTYTWTGGNAAAAGTTSDITFKETLGSGVANQEFSYGCSTLDSDGNTITATAFKVSWATSTQYTATLTIANGILPSISSVGYSGTVTKSSSIQAQEVVSLEKLNPELFEVKGRQGDSYSFVIALTLSTNYNATSALAISVASFSGTFGSANVALASSLTGTLALKETFILTRSVTSATEGDAFTIDLTTTNLVDNTPVPFTITGVSKDDLVRNGLTGSFQIFENEASETFQAVKDTLSEQPYETFTLTLNDISPTISTSVKIYDEVAQVTTTSIDVSPIGRASDELACLDSASEKAYFTLLDGQDALGNGVILFSDQSLQTPYASDGKYYKIGSNHNGIIGEVANGRISGYVECAADILVKVIEESETKPNPSMISSTSVSIPGSRGIDACEQNADTEIYYDNSITEGTLLYTQKDEDDNLSSVFGGVDKWHKLTLYDTDDNPQDHYALITSYPPGYVSRIFVCGTGFIPVTTITLTPRVTINMSTSDGNNQGFAFVSQRTELTAVVQNITNASYQWEKGSSSGASNMTNISGATSSSLVINEVGGGGETQTSAGVVFYNCKVIGTGVTTTRADVFKSITWQARTSFPLKFVADPSDNGIANNASCTGSSVTIHGDRDAITAFCVGTKFFANADGSGTLTRGTYSDSTSGTNNNYRYIAANGIAGPCINYGCAGAPVSQPTTNIQKVAVKRCDNQTNAGRTEYIIFNNFERQLGNIIKLKDFGQTGGEGCYEIIEIYADNYDLPTPNFTLETTDFVQLQPFGKCETCVGDIIVEVEEEQEIIINPNKYYGAYRLCGSTGGTLTYIVSDSSLPNVLRVGADTTKCRHTVYTLHNNEGDVKAYSPDALILEDLFWIEFNECTTCIGGSSAPTITGLPYKRKYKQCDDASKTIVFGHSENLAATEWAIRYPSVVYNGICYEDSTTSTDTTNINIDDLTNFRDCPSCDAFVNPPSAPVVERPSNIKIMRISSSSAISLETACNTLYTYDVNVYYIGTFGDNTVLYSDTALSTIYAPTSETNFRINENRNSFKIGYSGNPSGVRPGVVYNFGSCANVNIY